MMIHKCYTPVNILEATATFCCPVNTNKSEMKILPSAVSPLEREFFEDLMDMLFLLILDITGSGGKNMTI